MSFPHTADPVLFLFCHSPCMAMRPRYLFLFRAGLSESPSSASAKSAASISSLRYLASSSTDLSSSAGLDEGFCFLVRRLDLMPPSISRAAATHQLEREDPKDAETIQI